LPARVLASRIGKVLGTGGGQSRKMLFIPRGGGDKIRPGFSKRGGGTRGLEKVLKNYSSDRAGGWGGSAVSNLAREWNA